jgi:hypothetical protein
MRAITPIIWKKVCAVEIREAEMAERYLKDFVVVQTFAVKVASPAGASPI